MKDKNWQPPCDPELRLLVKQEAARQDRKIKELVSAYIRQGLERVGR